MKKIRILRNAALLLMIAFLTGYTVNETTAQTGKRSGCYKYSKMQKDKGCDYYNLPDLTDEQKQNIEDLKIELMKENMPLKNELMEKKARLRTLSTVENVDMKEVNNVIDDITGLLASMMKNGAEKMQNIRELLNEDQRLIFDSKPRIKCLGMMMMHGHHSKGPRSCKWDQNPHTGGPPWLEDDD